MENLLTVIGMLFFAFLLLAAAVEAVLEVFRGVLTAFGLGALNAGQSLDSVMAQADEFAPEGSSLRVRAAALVVAAEQLSDGLQTKIETLKEVREALANAGKPFDIPAALLAKLATTIRVRLEERERVRIFILRLIACGLGCFLVWLTKFYVLSIVGKAPEAEPYVGGMTFLHAPWLNIVLGGMGAAAGSSYWHDQLDKVRNLKAAVGGLKAVVETPVMPAKRIA